MIWVIAGTKSARELVGELLEAGHNVLATTVTGYGRELIGNKDRLIAINGALNSDEMVSLIRKYEVKLVVDASHPYSLEVKDNAYSASVMCRIPYLKFDRETVAVPGAVEFDTYSEAAGYLEGRQGDVLLSIGSKNIGYFRENGKGKIYARVLPLASSVSACEGAGYLPGRIIAMQFPFSEKFETELLRELDIKYLVTKESGSEGGLNEKISAAVRCGAEVIMIKRPVIEYGESFMRYDDIIKRVGEILNG